MSNIIQAINAMISNSNKITNVLHNDTEYYYLYDKKYKWSIDEIQDDNQSFWTLCYYPGPETIETLSKTEGDMWRSIEFVRYSTLDYKTRESLESFSELYRVVKEKIYNMDIVLKKIIDTDIPF